MTIRNSLRCPHCQRTLTDKGDRFQCESHGEYLCDHHGVVHFQKADEGYFTRHWTVNREAVAPASKLAAARRFLSPVISRGTNDDGSAIWFDVGTGDGIHLNVLSKEVPDIELVGLDISYGALESVAARVPSSLLMLADGHNIPLQDASVDGAFSFGVLAYMDDPWRGLAEMIRVTKPGGLIGVWFAPNRGLLGLCLRVVRSVVSRLGSFAQARIADLIVPLLGFLPTASGLSLSNASWSACREVVLVNIAPPKLIFPTREEVVQRFESLGCKIMSVDESSPITVWATRVPSLDGAR